LVRLETLGPTLVQDQQIHTTGHHSGILCHVYEHLISYSHNTEVDVSLCIAYFNSDYLWSMLLHK